MFDIKAADPRGAEALVLLDRLSETLAATTGGSGRSSFDPQDVLVAGALFVIARDVKGTAVGCGAYRRLAPKIAELKRMYAVPGHKGIGSSILAFLETRAEGDGYRELWLETRIANERAVRFYEDHGYRRVPNFGRYAGRPEAVCLAKRLGTSDRFSDAGIPACQSRENSE